jgi:hypothetical protein
MGSPATTGPPGQTTAAQPSRRFAASLPRDTRATRNFLRSFGFHMLAVLLGIALAFM